MSRKSELRADRVRTLPRGAFITRWVLFGCAMLVLFAAWTWFAWLADLGLGLVVYALTLALAYRFGYTYFLYRGDPRERLVKGLVLLSAALFVASATRASDWYLYTFGREGVGMVYEERSESARSGHVYQCTVTQPDGEVRDTRAHGHCPGRDFTSVRMVYDPSGVFRPALTTKGGLDPWSGPLLVLSATSVLSAAAVVSARYAAQPLPIPANRPSKKSRNPGRRPPKPLRRPRKRN
ncbi:hypothetical protein [Yinghuangia seranimata]|uniref:hypothetical protein n=1 Tax=Yinghuangia seranimata TaxID=408067 RepID=UPI00248B1531|nr:hypothetical protein [Yinghuangia seranimata]MDI2125086.1 hypothetical protein [Yinghuangia seranimata]